MCLENESNAQQQVKTVQIGMPGQGNPKLGLFSGETWRNSKTLIGQAALRLCF